MTKARDVKVEVWNVNAPDHITRVDKAKYDTMRQAMEALLPSGPPGLTQAEIREGVKPLLDQVLFPGGAKAGWWAKTVQLDMEARDVLVREATKPLRWHLPAD